jgi:outer membrane protein TolC
MRANWVLALLGLWPVYGQTQPPSALPGLLEEALRRNPEVLAAQKKLESARQRPAQAASLPDPMLELGYTSNGGPLPGQGLGTEPVSNIGFMASQQLPGPGKRRLRREIAWKEASAAEREYWQTQLSVVSRVKMAWHRLHHNYAQIDLLDRNRQLLERMLRVSQIRYQTGQAAQADILRAQTQLALLETKALRFRQEIRAREAEINSLLARALETPVPKPPDIEPREVMLTLERIYEQAQAHSPVLARERTLVERTELALNLARKEGTPDYKISGGYFTMGRMPDMYQARVEFNLPFFTRSRQRAAVAEQSYALDQARRSYQTTGNTMLFRLKDDWLLSETSWRLMRMYTTTLMPQAALTVEASIPAYETGQVDFLTLLNNLTTLLEFESAYHEEMMNYHLALLRIEEATGLELVEE